MNDFLVYDDVTGDFIAVRMISAVTARDVGGSTILVAGSATTLSSPLRPREVLRRLTIMQYKRDNAITSSAPAPVAA